MADVIVVGAGPAGIRAAEVLCDSGINPTIIDEGKQPGGQAHRAIAPELGIDIDALLGSEAEKYRGLHSAFERLRSKLDYRSRTTAWGVFDNQLYVQGPGGTDAIPYDALVLAIGATDRVLPIPGWTRPGVFTLGGAQVLLKDQGCLIGRRVVLCGSSPLLYLAALQYRQMGGEVAAVLDTSSLRDKALAFKDLSASLPTLRRGLGYMASLRASGVPIKLGVRLLSFDGDSAVTGVTYADGSGTPRQIDCDAVAFGFGLRAETQLTELAGGKLAFDPVFRQWLPATDDDGRCGRGLYVAGDGAMIGGADAAELSGELAAYALLDDLGRKNGARPDITRKRRTLSRLRRFQRGLARAFAWPAGEVARLSDDTMLCRCEAVSVGDLRRVMAADLPPQEVNRVKALTRCGMGRCQGRFCGLAAGEIAAAALARPIGDIGYMRAQAPVKPLSIAPAGEVR